MAARVPALRLLSTARRSAATPLTTPTISQLARRSFQTSRALRADGVTATRRPVGAFRGTLFGFLLGSVFAGAGLYYYVVDEYKVSNELLTEDIYALQAAVQRLEGYVRGIEDGQKETKKGS